MRQTLLALFLVMLSHTPGTAQQSIPVSVPNSLQPDAKCNAALIGEITATSVAETIEQLDATQNEIGQIAANLCLDSGGGSLNAAKTLIDYMESKTVGDSYIATVVDAEKECKSACAFVFMAGFTCFNDKCWPNRNLAGGGTLAFHAPYPQVDGAIPDNKLSEAIALGVSNVMSLVNMNNNNKFRGSPRFPTELVNYTLTHMGEDYFVVDEIKEALMLEINLFGAWLDVASRKVTR